MLYYLGSQSFKRKIWQFFERNYCRRIPKAEREPINSEVIERYIGISIDKYREYTREAATAAGYCWESYGLKWRIYIPTRQEAQQLNIQAPTNTNYPEFYYLNHAVTPKQTYLSVLQTNNRILEAQIQKVVDRLVQASIVIRSKSVKTNAKKLENLLLWMINEQLTEDNRIVVRICMNRFDMPFTKWSNHGYYRNCSILLEPSLIRLMNPDSYR